MKQIITLITLLSFGLAFGQACGGLTSINYNGHTYELVEIGNQCWFKENLQTNKYRDGQPIPYHGADSIAWQNSTGAAYAWYDNDSTTFASYWGALYKWNATNNSPGLCPTGWHVPSDAEWTVLDSFLSQNGYNYDGSLTGNKYAKAMAKSNSWGLSTATGGPGNTDFPSYQNKSGFSATPSGFRSSNGSFDIIYTNWGFWWTSTREWSNTFGEWRAVYRSINNYGYWVNRFYAGLGHGYAVRCLKDTGSIQTSMNEYDILNLNLYPNPFTSSTTIELPSEPHTLTIYDIVGNKIREEQVSGTTTIERGDLTKGVYVIDVRSESQTYSGKLVVE